MSAGLPGLGLGGLFFIFSALLAPFRQLWRTFRGRSRAGDWGMIGRQFAQAAMMVAAIDLALRLAYLGIAAAGLGSTPSAVSTTVIPLTLIGITSALLVGVLATAKLADIAVRLQGAELPRMPDAMPRATPLRTLALGGLVVLAWLALLVAGASELSPLESPRGGATTKQLANDGQDLKSNPARSVGRPQAETVSEPASVSPRAFDAVKPVAVPDHESGSSEPGTAVQPASSTPVPPSVAPTHQEPTPSPTPPVGAPSLPSVSPASEPSPVVSPPHPTGPPASAGPPEASPAPEHGGPPEPPEPPPAAKK